MTKLFRNNEKDLILIIKDQNNEMIYFKIVREKERAFEI